MLDDVKYSKCIQISQIGDLLVVTEATALLYLGNVIETNCKNIKDKSFIFVLLRKV